MKDIHSIRHIIQEVFCILTKKQKRQFFIILLLIIGGSGFELLGVTVIIPFIQAITSPESFANLPLFKSLLSSLNMTTTANMVVVMSVISIIIYAVKNIYLLVAGYFQICFRCTFQTELSQRMLKTYLKRPYVYFLETNSSKMLRGINSDVSGVYNILQHGSRIIAELFTCVLIGAYIFYVDAIMATGVFVIAFTTMILMTKVSKPKLSKMGNESREVSALQNKYSYQAILGNKEIKVMHRTRHFVDVYSNVANAAKKINISYNFLLSLPERVIEIVSIAGIFILVCISFQYGGGSVPFIEKLAAFAVASFRILPSISRMTSDLNGIVFNKAPMEATYQNLKEVEEYEKSHNQELEAKKINKNIDSNYKFKETLSINNISWKYPNSEEYVLHNTGFSIKKGEAVGIIGSSGAGKSTLTDIILGLLYPQEGDVEMDGIDILTIPEQWSKNVGYVPQTVYLTDDSIASNIAFGLSDDEIDEEKIWKSLEQAMLADFVRTLPEGIRTRVGERGVKLSGGQRQRIAIARALYYDPDIFVLDEATAALDNETEAELMQSIDSLQGIKTIIIVAHRLTTIKKCDKIYEVINGAIVERTKEEVFG